MLFFSCTMEMGFHNKAEIGCGVRTLIGRTGASPATCVVYIVTMLKTNYCFHLVQIASACKMVSSLS